jgi:hypothetical protein
MVREEITVFLQTSVYYPVQFVGVDALLASSFGKPFFDLSHPALPQLGICEAIVLHIVPVWSELGSSEPIPP